VNRVRYQRSRRGIVPDARSLAIGKCRNCAALKNLDDSCLADKLPRETEHQGIKLRARQRPLDALLAGPDEPTNVQTPAHPLKPRRRKPSVALSPGIGMSADRRCPPCQPPSPAGCLDRRSSTPSGLHRAGIDRSAVSEQRVRHGRGQGSCQLPEIASRGLLAVVAETLSTCV
jgi:hypothetical protein